MKITGTKVLILVGVLLMLGSILLHNSSDYMHKKEVPVTFIDKRLDQSCHKSRCRDYMVGLFKTERGVYFERPISFYMYSQMHLGEKFNLNIRRMDIKQTGWENIVFFFGPVILFSFGVTCLVIVGIGKLFEEPLDTPTQIP